MANPLRNKITKGFTIALSVFILLTLIVPVTTLAASAEDVLTEVTQQHLSAPTYASDVEQVSGGSFRFYEGLGDLGSGWAQFSILEPIGNTGIEPVLEFTLNQFNKYVDSDGEARFNRIAMDGYELREYILSDEVGVWLILPQYMIEVCIIESGNDSRADLQAAKNYAQQLLDGLDINDAEGQVMEEAQGITQEPKTDVQEQLPVSAIPLDQPTAISNTDNIAAVGNGPTQPTTFTINRPHLVTYIRNYHWNSARGAEPGLIGLVDQDGKICGPWQATGTAGQGGVPNANWEVSPNVVIPAGTYTVTDSDMATWSANAESGGRGMGQVHATPHFELPNGSSTPTEEFPGMISVECDHNPAGVGSVGNIPGPSNTTEAVVGVAVPGLIAISLGALSGLGGGGLTPPEGNPITPKGGRTNSVGPSPKPGKRPGAVQSTNLLGRRRREDRIDTAEMVEGLLTVSGNESNKQDIFIDTSDMGEGTVTTGLTNDLWVETADEAAILMKPKDRAIVDTAGEEALLHKRASSIITETAEEAGLFNLAKPMAGEGSFDHSNSGILIDTSALEERGSHVTGAEPLVPDEQPSSEPGEALRETYDENGFDSEGYNREGYNQSGYDREGYNSKGFDEKGYNREGFNQSGYDREGYNSKGFDREGYNQSGFDEEGYDREGFNQSGYDREGYNSKGFDREGYNQNGFDEEGYNREGYNQSGYDREGYNSKGFDREGYNQSGYDEEGYNREGFNQSGYDREGYNSKGFDEKGYDREGYNQNGYDEEGYNREGFNQSGYDREGYGRNGYNASGYDREGFDVNGYNAKGFNRRGYNSEGYDASGYDKEGFNKAGWDKDGFGRDGLNKNGYDREGYDKNGYDKDGYNREGYDREGMQREGYDEFGYDKDGFNQNGFDRDGYDRDGFNYEGYSRGGYDPWGYNKQGYNKEGYHWSGYNADGYNSMGRHWSENPYEGDGNPFNVATQDPFGEGEVIPFGATWKPTKPPLGEPYPKTLEKYGAKPWTDPPEKPQAEIPVPKGKDDGSFVPGPQDPQKTSENHDVGTNPADKPAESDALENPLPNEPGDAKSSDIFTYTDPETGETAEYEYEEGYTGPRHGDGKILVGKADGQIYELEFNAVKGTWINKETGNEFYPEEFERWQNDLAIDKERIAKDLEKMSKRQDANSKAIDRQLDDWKKLEQMQKVADRYNIGEHDGPGDVDKAIEKLKDDMLAGKELDQEKMDKIRRVIDHRILGKTTADNGSRWEELPWYQDLGSALKANAATAKEVVTGEKEDGSISWLGMGARIMITAASGGATLAGQIGSQVVVDGALTIAEAMYRIKDSIDKGESDFKAVSKAIGLTILGEELGWLAGKAGGKLMGEMMERFPVFTNKAADALEKGLLKIMQADQVVSRGLNLVSKEGAEETLKQIEKRLADLGGDAAEEAVEKATTSMSRKAAGFADDAAAKAAGKVASSSGDDLVKSGGKVLTESGDSLTQSSAKVMPSSADDMAKGRVKVTSTAQNNLSKGSLAADPVTGSKAASTGDDLAGKPLGQSGDQAAKSGNQAAEGSANPAEKTVKDHLKDYNKLPESKKQELISSQKGYKDYMEAASNKSKGMVEKLQKGDSLSTEDLLNMKSDPGAMRKIKDVQSLSDLPTAEARRIQTEFNEALNKNIYTPTYRDVQDHIKSNLDYDALKAKYGDDIQVDVCVETVRTPGKEYHEWDINTDNDVHSVLTIRGKNGNILESREIPRSQWQNKYFDSYAKHTGVTDKAGNFKLELAKSRYPDVEWEKLQTDAERIQKWADLHEEAPSDVFHPEAARDFSVEKTAILNGKAPDMAPAAAAKLGKGTLLDAEQLGKMETYKIGRYWSEGTVKSRTEAFEQLGKLAEQTKGLEKGYARSYKIAPMPPKMNEAIDIVKDRGLSPAMRAAKLQKLGFDGPSDVANQLASRIHALRIAVKK